MQPIPNFWPILFLKFVCASAHKVITLKRKPSVKQVDHLRQWFHINIASRFALWWIKQCMPLSGECVRRISAFPALRLASRRGVGNEAKRLFLCVQASGAAAAFRRPRARLAAQTPSRWLSPSPTTRGPASSKLCSEIFYLAPRSAFREMGWPRKGRANCDLAAHKNSFPSCVRVHAGGSGGTWCSSPDSLSRRALTSPM